MINKKYLFLEILSIIALVSFIIFISLIYTQDTEKSIDEISAPVLQKIDDSVMTQKSKADIAKTFDFDLSKAEGIVYYSNDNIMDVSELLIIKLNDNEDASNFKKSIEKRVENQKNLYKNYAPEQYSLLEASIIEVKGNTVFYCTAKSANNLYEAYKKAL